MWWDHIPDANCTGVKGEHCSVDAAPGGYVMATALSTMKKAKCTFDLTQV